MYKRQVFDVAVQQIIPQLIRSHHGTIVLALRCGGAQVRDAHRAFRGKQRLAGEIAHITGHAARFQRVHHGGRIHQLAPGKVQDAHAVLHLGNEAVVHLSLIHI